MLLETTSAIFMSLFTFYIGIVTIVFATVSRPQISYSPSYERLFGCIEIYKAEDLCTIVIIIFATVSRSKISYSREMNVCLAAQMI